MTRCAKPGCKSTTLVRGSVFCAPHDPDKQHTGGAPIGNTNALKHGLYSLYTPQERDDIETFGAVGDLANAVEICRVLLMRNFRDDDRAGVIATVNALVKAEVAQKRLSGGQANTLLEAVDQVLANLGVGGEGE